MSYIDTSRRIKKFQTFLVEQCVDSCLIEDPINLLYFTGLELSAGTLFFTPSDILLLVDGRYFEKAQSVSSICVRLSSSTKIEDLIVQQKHLKTVGFDSSTTTFERYSELNEKVQNIAQVHSNPLSLIPLSQPVMSLRLYKDSKEIEMMRQAAALACQGFHFVCSILREGISEYEVANELEIFWKKRGGKRVGFDPIIAFGVNSSMPHYRAGNTRLTKGHSILIDIGVVLDHYHSDMTRVIFFGEADDSIKKIFNIVKDAQQAALEYCRPGVLLGELDQKARDLITAQGYGPQFSHSLGHGIGLDIHEFPTIKNAEPYKTISLQPGMVITIEPGIYLPGIGGVRIEDTVVITEEGYENLIPLSKNITLLAS